MPNRIQNINASLARECLAQRTHILIDWPAVSRGDFAGDIQFENAWYLLDRSNDAHLAMDATPAPRLSVTLSEALAFEVPLGGPTTTITGAHVMQFIKAFHSQRMEALLAPPDEPTHS